MSRQLMNRGLQAFIRSQVQARKLPPSFDIDDVVKLVAPAFPNIDPKTVNTRWTVGNAVRGLCEKHVLKKIRHGVYGYRDTPKQAGGNGAHPETPFAVDATTKALNDALEALVTVEKVVRQQIKLRQQLKSAGIEIEMLNG